MSSLASKSIIITGASRGIGSKTAVYLAQYKPRLVLVARSMEGLQEVSRKCQEKGLSANDVFVCPADLESKDDLQRIVKDTVEKFGSIDVLINNACFAPTMSSVGHYTYETFDKNINVNLRAPMFLSQAAMPYLLKSKGSVINISGTVGSQPEGPFTTYGASKVALEYISKCQASEMAPQGVRVNVVVPGLTRTEIYTSPNEELNAKVTELAKKSQPLGGLAEPEDVAKVIKFLASDEAAAITGETIYVDRGRHLVGPSDERQWMDMFGQIYGEKMKTAAK